MSAYGSAAIPAPAEEASRAAVAALLEADAAAWHRSATAWVGLADQLDRAEGLLAGDGRALSIAWAAGGGAAAARQRLEGHRSAVAGAAGPARHIADALADHAYGLVALQRLAGTGLPHPERLGLLARARELDERTAARLLTSTPPAPAAPASAPGRGPLDRASVEAQRGRSPSEVRAWWLGLTTAQRAWALVEHAEVLGWLDGLPAADRDRANRTVLDRDIGALMAREADLAHRLDRARFGLPAWLTPPVLLPAVVALELELARVRAELAGLATVRSSLQGLDNALLLGVDGAGDGRAVIALGDPDHARHTAVFVPGVESDLLDTPGALDRVSRLQQAADVLSADPHDVSAIYWLGYDAPEVSEALSSGPAWAGAEPLARFVDGLRAGNEGGAGHISVIGHSYGSAVLAEAALRAGLRVDDIVAVGSPGMHTDHAADLGIDPRHVWSGHGAGDLIGGDLGALPWVHGQEPTDPAFGANRFAVDTQGHGAYWDPGSLSLRNQAAIVAGRYDLVSLVHGHPPVG